MPHDVSPYYLPSQHSNNEPVNNNKINSQNSTCIFSSFLRGDISLSKNPQALSLYSGSIGAILETSSELNWYYDTLINASIWLKNNNPLFTNFTYLPERNPLNPHPAPIPTAVLSTPATFPSSNIPQLVIPNNTFPPEIHNEDYRYDCLLAGTVELNNNTIPISYNNTTLEGILSPDLFPTGKGHYENLKETL
ncbi:13006_t:CDS:2, partial [Gigaspora rosea]